MFLFIKIKYWPKKYFNLTFFFKLKTIKYKNNKQNSKIKIKTHK